MNPLLLSLVLLGVAPFGDSTGLYRAELLRAAPGQLQNLVDYVKREQQVFDAAGLPRPLLLRHSQGDHWDIMVLEPISTLSEYFSPDRAARWSAARRSVGPESQAPGEDGLVAWREEIFVAGPSHRVFHETTDSAGYFHAEMFVALPAHRGDLLRERAMEDAFSAAIGRPTNLVFTRIAGAAWDCFTVGFYRDLRHYAEPSGLTADQEDAAAKRAGFESRGAIGVYLRRWIASHHDTLGGIIR